MSSYSVIEQTIANSLVLDIQASNVKRLSEPEGFDTFSDSLYKSIDEKHRIDSYTVTDDFIDIEFKGKESATELSTILESVIDSTMNMNREDMNNFMLINRLSQKDLNNHIVRSYNVLDMSPQKRKSRIYRVNLHN